jgi:hypothetical protein
MFTSTRACATGLCALALCTLALPAHAVTLRIHGLQAARHSTTVPVYGGATVRTTTPALQRAVRVSVVPATPQPVRGVGGAYGVAHGPALHGVSVLRQHRMLSIANGCNPFAASGATAPIPLCK